MTLFAANLPLQANPLINLRGLEWSSNIHQLVQKKIQSGHTPSNVELRPNLAMAKRYIIDSICRYLPSKTLCCLAIASVFAYPVVAKALTEAVLLRFFEAPRYIPECERYELISSAAARLLVH